MKLLDDRTRRDLFDYLKHGDAAHQEWLWRAINAFCMDLPRPPVVAYVEPNYSDATYEPGQH